MHPRYEEWLRHIFDHPVTDPAWYWAIDAESFEASETDYVTLIEQTCRRSGMDLQRYSDAKVNQGLWFLMSCGCSDYILALRSEKVPLTLRLAAISSIYVLYRDCFFPRCTRTLSNLDESPHSDLNAVCYMLWDTSILTNLGGLADGEQLTNACFDVLADTLKLDHPACQEAAIHGYGHFHFTFPRRVADAMKLFLRTPIADPRLRTYAADARTGSIA